MLRLTISAGSLRFPSTFMPPTSLTRSIWPFPTREILRIAPFSTDSVHYKHQHGHREPQQQPPRDNPEMPKFSLDGLGISPSMKKVIIGIVCIFGTMETYTYYRWFRTWYYGEDEKPEATS